MADENLAPPVAPTRPCRRTIGGRLVDDPYAWLEDKDDPAVLAYLNAENAYREASLAATNDLQTVLYQELVGRIKETDVSVPARYGAWRYYTRTEEGRQYPVLARTRDEPGAGEEIVLDLNLMVGDTGYLRLICWAPSPDHRLLAYGLNETGGLEVTLAVKDLVSGDVLPEIITPAWSDIAWSNDGAALYYLAEDAARRPFELRRHLLGTDPADDAVLYREEDPVFALRLDKARDGAFLFLTSSSHTESEVRYLPAATAAAELTLYAPKQPNVEYFLDHHGDDFLILTNDGAVNFRLLAAPVNDRSARRELIPHRDDVLLEQLEVFARGVAVFGREAGASRLFLLDPVSGNLRQAQLPEATATIRPDANYESGSHVVRIRYSSFVTPPSTYDVDLVTGEALLLKQDEVPSGHDPDLYETERLVATASDGARVPISLVRRRDQPPGPRPLLLAGYGAYGYSYDPYFDRSLLSLLDRGVTFAIAHIRGGQELGRPWYEHGKLLHKQNTFTDFIACAEYLIDLGRTTPEQLVITGESAGGLLIGAVTNLRPDLMRAAVAEVPFVDVIRVMLDESIPLTAGEWVEWGDPRQPEFFEYMRSYSPYDNVTAAAYPEMLITAGLGDNQVSYWEPAKWLSKLRQHSTSGRPLYLRINLGAGHAGASGRYDHLRETAHDYAFMLRAWGLAGEARGDQLGAPGAVRR